MLFSEATLATILLLEINSDISSVLLFSMFSRGFVTSNNIQF